MDAPDSDLVIQTFEEIRRRHDRRDLESEIHLNASHEEWAKTPLLERRIGWREDKCPRFVYKYRGPPLDAGRKRLEDILLRHQLWLADSSHYEDPLDSHVEYRLTLTGDALYRHMVAHQRRVAIVSRFRAERMVSREICDHPEALQEMLRKNHERMLKDWGICSLAANARDPRLWDEYGAAHTGVSIQFHPPRDFRAFIDLQQIEYSDAERLMENPLPGAESQALRFKLLMTKRKQYAFEDEWRVVAKLKANQPHSFEPAALTGIILGADAEAETEKAVAEILDQREKQTGHRPTLYRATIFGGRIRIHCVAPRLI